MADDSQLYQPGILEGVPRVARYVQFTLAGERQPARALKDAMTRISPLVNGRDVVIGLAPALVKALGGEVPGLHEFPELGGSVKVPVTPGTLWCWVRGDDLGDLLHVTRKLQKALAPVFTLRHVTDAFRHRHDGVTGFGRDLTGFEDGTENPKDGEAIEAAFAHGQGEGLDGASFVAVQQWVHDLDAFDAMPEEHQNHAIGRRLSDNEEIEDAPESAHVKRTAQESFDPEAFVLRRSMPWLASTQAGLMFVAFGKSFDAFEAQMRRMAGLDDGIVDGVFKLSRPVSGSYYWCPPMRGGQLDLRRLGFR
ncbi:Dyp-type peroxidase [Ramlibacter humi]|uniref:Dyp-type peroxidase n=1 Tax=Ramlibacter humi TaxID=2530451 RepID=A0A4Z0BTJ6_9BURK|nr:Dyp-type peroxidase [Ramlibacter humi]TFZ02072.1 Dyp-type peroxidase [Ramlibacter humi]